MCIRDREDKARSAAHAEGQGGGEGQKNFHGRGYGEGHALGSLQRERLGNQFAQDHVQAGDHGKRDADGDGMSIEDGLSLIHIWGKILSE